MQSEKISIQGEEEYAEFRPVYIEDNGKHIGSAILRNVEKPFPITVVGAVMILSAYRGKGYGTKLIEFINNTIVQEGRVGLLRDSIDDDSGAKGLYEKHGWTKLPGPKKIMVFNLPKDKNVSELDGVYEASIE